MNNTQERLERVFWSLNEMVQDADEAISKTRTVRDRLRAILNTPLRDDDLAIVNEECNLSLEAGSTAKDALDAVAIRKAEEGDQKSIEMIDKFGIGVIG